MWVVTNRISEQEFYMTLLFGYKTSLENCSCQTAEIILTSYTNLNCIETEAVMNVTATTYLNFVVSCYLSKSTSL